QCRLQGHGHVPGHPDGQVGNDPVGTVLGKNGDVAARRQLLLQQPAGEAPHLVAHLGPAQLLLAAFGQRLYQIDAIRLLTLMAEEVLEHGQHSPTLLSHALSPLSFSLSCYRTEAPRRFTDQPGWSGWSIPASSPPPARVAASPGRPAPLSASDNAPGDAPPPPDSAASRPGADG